MSVRALSRRRRFDRLALRLALLYLALAAAWVIGTDLLLGIATGMRSSFALGQTLKGLAFVAVTTQLLYLLVRRDYRLLEQSDVELAAAQARIEALLAQALREQLPIAVWTTDRKLHLTAVTGSLARRMIGDDAAEALLGTYVGDRDELGSDGLAAHRAALRGEPGSYHVELLGTRLEAHVEPLRESATKEIVGVVGLALDVSERDRVEAELRQAAKLEAVGRLAGGVAHDFNNLLTGVLGFLGDAQRSLGEHPVRADLEQAERAARRAADLTQQLLTFARRDEGTPEPLELGATLRALVPLLAEVAGPAVRVEHVDEGDCWAAIRPLPLEQVVVNLVANARDAQPDGGRIRVRTSNVERDDERWACVEVADEGYGLSEDVRRHLFEPFFTTKPAGRGTGLGLATSRAAVEDAGGRIEVESEPGRGTSFRVLLPCVDPPEQPQHEPEPPGPRRHVLLVEDEEALRELFARWLEDAGHAVEPTAGAEDALALLGDGRYDAVVSDVTLPDGSGIDVAAAAHERDPARPVVLMSGRTVETEQLPPGTTVLQKPFGRDELLAALGG